MLPLFLIQLIPVGSVILILISSNKVVRCFGVIAILLAQAATQLTSGMIARGMASQRIAENGWTADYQAGFFDLMRLTDQVNALGWITTACLVLALLVRPKAIGR